MNEQNNEENNRFELKEEQEYSLNINYLDENPFSPFIKGVVFPLGYGSASITLGTILGCFIDASSTYLVNIVIGLLVGGSSFLSIGLSLGFIGIFGTAGFKLYKSFKEDKYKEFYQKLSSSNEMKEEREIYNEALSKINSYFIKYFKPYENEIKENMEKILLLILEIYNSLESHWITTKIIEYRRMHSNISNLIYW